MEKKVLFCRVPEDVHTLIHQQAAGPKSIGTFIAKAMRDYVNRDEHLVHNHAAFSEMT